MNGTFPTWFLHRWATDPGRVITIGVSLALLLCWTLAPALLLLLALPVGIACTAGFVLLLAYRSRQQLILPDLLPLWALLGMWVAPALQYLLEEDEALAYPMPVSRTIYFSIVLPGVIMLILGTQLRLFARPTADHALLQRSIGQLAGQGTQPMLLTGAGVRAFMLLPWLPPGLAFIAYLGQALLWVALLQACFLPDSRVRYLIMAVALLTNVWQAIQSTMFSDLIFGIVGVVLYVLLHRPRRLRTLLACQLAGFLALCWLITFKYEYRKQATTATGILEKASLFSRSGLEALTHPFSGRSLDYILSRINQGSISALTFRYVPAQEPFAQGETIKTAVLCALVPRVLYPDKPRAGGVENCRRFMGIENLTYSINMGVVGEAYVNYGARSGAWFLFIYGLVLRAVYDGFRWLSARMTGLFFFLPFVFLPVISIETDVLIVLNHLVKAGLVALLIAWLFTKWPKTSR